MSAEVLRRAAAALRKHAEEASKGWRVDVVGPLGAETVLTFNDVVTNLWKDAAFAALMSPPVALALADALDAEAHRYEVGLLVAEMVALARAVLREEP